MQVRLAVLACRHELATGHAHMAVAAVQALLEFHCFAPPALGKPCGAMEECFLLWLILLQAPAALGQHALLGAVWPHAMSLLLLTPLSAPPMVISCLLGTGLACAGEGLICSWSARLTPCQAALRLPSLRVHLALACCTIVQQPSAHGAASHICRPGHRSAQSLILDTASHESRGGQL